MNDALLSRLELLQKDCSISLAMATLLLDLDIDKVTAILQRLKFPTNVVDTVVNNVAQHMKFFEVEKMKKATLVRFVRQENFVELLELHRLDCLASNGDLSSYKFVTNFLMEVPATQLNPERLVTGDDLLAFGLTPGPLFRTILTAVETAQLEGQVTTKEQAMALVAQLIEPE